jgi:Mg2+ and Co2+ transporter CorA
VTVPITQMVRTQTGPPAALSPFADHRRRSKQIDRDLRLLSAYEGQLSSGIVYLHYATLGLINLDQNRIIKVFWIAAVMFLPQPWSARSTV